MPHTFLAGGGELGALVRAHDWAATPLGPIEAWPQSLTTAVGTVLLSPVPIVLLWGPDGIMIYNDAYSAFAGGRHPRILGSKVREGWPEVADFNDNVMRVGLAGGTLSYRDQELTLDRYGRPERVWMNLDYSPILDEAGRPAGVVAIVLETTERVLTERRLRMSEALARENAERVQLALAAGAIIGTWVWDLPEDRFTVDAAFARSFGLDPALGRDGLSLEQVVASVHPDDKPGLSAAIGEAVARGGRYAHQYRVRRADGRYYWLEANGHVDHAPDGTPLRFPGVLIDVEGRRTVEAERDRAIAQLRALNDTLEQQVRARTAERDMIWRTTPDLLCVASLDGRFVSVNPAWPATLGWSEAEITAQPYLAFVHPDDHEVTVREMAGLVRGEPVLGFENRYRHRDGGWRWLSWNAAPRDGYIYATVRDVTETKHQAAALAQAEEALRQSQKMEAVGQLTGGVAHDFNNLLTVIKSSTDLLKRPGLAEERRARYVGAISDTVDRAARLTGQLLAFARRQALKPEVFDAAHAVTAVADMVGTLTGARIRIETRVDPRFKGEGDGAFPCLVEADPSQFDTALVNMAVNARDAMDGEGRLTIVVTPEGRIPAVRAHPAVAGDFVAVSLTDTGSGIAPEDLDRIFEPFFTTKGVGQGTGLGLSQVFGFAKQSGGDVTVSSAVGVGTTFTLYLPRAAGAAPAEPRTGEPVDASDGHGVCVLVVEDNQEVGAFATQALAELGYSTVWAHDARAALAELERVPFRFEAMFSDVVMPGMNGVDLAREVQRLRPDLAVVLASGYSHVLAEEGAHGFDLLHKPYSIEQLSRALRRAICERRARR